MSGGFFLDDRATLFSRTGENTFQVSLLRGVSLSLTDGITGGDELPKRSATLYFFDARSACAGADGAARTYVTPAEWEMSGDRSGVFTFGAAGGDWLAPGDLTSLGKPPYAVSYRIVGVERFSRGRKHMRHFKITGA